MPKKSFKIFLFVFVISLATFFGRIFVHAGSCPDKDYDCQIKEIQRSIDALLPAHEHNKAELASLRSQITQIQSRIKSISSQLDVLEKNIQDREEKKELRRQLFEEKTKHYYIALRQYDPLTPFLFAGSAADIVRQISIRQRVISEDQNVIADLASEIISLNKDKETLTVSRESLKIAQSGLDKKATFLQGEVDKVGAYLASLTAKQQQLLAEKLQSLNLPTSLGAGPLYCTDDRNINPGFSPAFAFYTYGIPHRVGMDQYGAYGRAKAGQNYKDILNAYFSNIVFEKKPNINITVSGYGTMPLETYLLGVYEMPGDWPIEALKAQAVAARSYALAYTNNGSNSICTTQSCQVYKGGDKGGNWEAAVRATEGEVMTSGGQPITAWYSSTDGGYTFTNSDIWGGSTKPWTKRLQDTSGSISNFSDLAQKAYDKDSPCFYSAQGWRKDYGSSAWLKGEEVADIVNVWQLATSDPGTQSHLSQVDKPNPDGVDTWDAGRVRQELQNRGKGAYSNISNITVDSWDTGSGKTTSLAVSGDSGTETISADQFVNYFNLRAPANIQIVGPLFNIEKK